MFSRSDDYPIKQLRRQIYYEKRYFYQLLVKCILTRVYTTIEPKSEGIIYDYLQLILEFRHNVLSELKNKFTQGENTFGYINQ